MANESVIEDGLTDLVDEPGAFQEQTRALGSSALNKRQKTLTLEKNEYDQFKKQIKTSLKYYQSKISKAQDGLNDRYRELNESIEQSKADLSEMIEQQIDTVKKDNEDRQVKSIEALGLFVALFTYISVSIQIFNRIQDVITAALFNVLIFCGLAGMVVLLNLLLNRSNSESDISQVSKKNGQNIFLRILLGLLFVVVIDLVLMSLGGHLNPVQGTVEFDKSYEDRVKKYIADYASTTLYTKEQVQALASSTVKVRDAEILKCYESTGSLYMCLR